MIPFNNYDYFNSKPIKNLGDSSVDSDSFNDMDNKENSSFYLNFKNKNNSRILNPNKQLVIKKMIIKPKNFSINEPKSNYNFFSKDKDKNNEIIEKKIDKEYKFKAINKFKNIKENKRYNGLDKLLKNNFKFLNDLNDDESDDNEEIIDNEVTINIMEGFNSKNKQNIEKRHEINKENISKINSRISNYYDNINKLREKKDDIKIGNSLINNKINKKNMLSFKFHENKKKSININVLKINKSKCNKNYNFQNNNNNIFHGKEVKLNTSELNKNFNMKANKDKYDFMNGIKSIKSEGNNLNNNYFELVKYKYFFGNRNKINKKKFSFNLTKNYKIFQKFLCLGIDTSGLYTLDDDMKNFILNPKITFNFPFNNLESELE